jgi:hypothetical protein
MEPDYEGLTQDEIETIEDWKLVDLPKILEAADE